MFKYDWFSIVIFQMSIIFLSPLNPLFYTTEGLLNVWPTIGLFGIAIFLLYKNESFQGYKFLVLFQKALKIIFFSYFLIFLTGSLILFLGILSSSLIGGKTSAAIHVAASKLPVTLVQIFDIHFNFILLIPFTILLAWLLRKKLKPLKIEMSNHLIDSF